MDERIGANEIAVYTGLAKHADAVSGLCWPSVMTLARYTRLSDRTVQRTLKRLEDLGYIEVDRIKGVVNRYYLLDVEVIPTPELVSPGVRTTVTTPRNSDTPSGDTDSHELEPRELDLRTRAKNEQGSKVVQPEPWAWDRSYIDAARRLVQ